MPELPEVETIRRDLRLLLIGKKIKNVEVILPRLVKSNLKEFTNSLTNNYFTDINRVGKLLIFKLSRATNKFLLIHLRMTGQLVYCKNKELVAGGHSTKENIECKKNKHTFIIFNFGSAEKLFFNDQRTFGALKLVNEEELKIIISSFGIEPLKKNFSPQAIKSIIQKRQINIKSILLNQHLISGIGNIYADEILFRSGISPLRIANTLSDNEIIKIHNSAEFILKNAIKNRGTTFNNYVDAKGQKGNYVKKLKVYGRAGLPCLKCSAILDKVKVAGRGTVYCGVCQK